MLRPTAQASARMPGNVRTIPRPCQHHHLPRLRGLEGRDHADGRLPVVLCVRGLRHALEAEAGRLLRLLLLGHRRLSAGAGRPGVLRLIDRLIRPAAGFAATCRAPPLRAVRPPTGVPGGGEPQRQADLRHGREDRRGRDARAGFRPSGRASGPARPVQFDRSAATGWPGPRRRRAKRRRHRIPASRAGPRLRQGALRWSCPRASRRRSRGVAASLPALTPGSPGLRRPPRLRRSSTGPRISRPGTPRGQRVAAQPDRSRRAPRVRDSASRIAPRRCRDRNQKGRAPLAARLTQARRPQRHEGHPAVPGPGLRQSDRTRAPGAAGRARPLGPTLRCRVGDDRRSVSYGAARED